MEVCSDAIDSSDTMVLKGGTLVWWNTYRDCWSTYPVRLVWADLPRANRPGFYHEKITRTDLTNIDVGGTTLLQCKNKHTTSLACTNSNY